MAVTWSDCPQDIKSLGGVWCGIHGTYDIPAHLEPAAELAAKGWKMPHFEEWLMAKEDAAKAEKAD